jgi:hypothetical protein
LDNIEIDFTRNDVWGYGLGWTVSG